MSRRPSGSTTTGLAARLATLVIVGAIAEGGPATMVEMLGVVERQARARGYLLSPGTERYPPRLIVGFDGDDGSWVVNLRDGSSRKASAPGFEREYVFWPYLFGADGKVFASCHPRGGLAVYDPIEDSLKLIHPIANARWLRGMAIGPDGGVYVSDYPNGAAARYDPNTGNVDSYGRQGGPFTIKSVHGYSIGCDGRWVYTAAGKMPWYVVAYDRETGKQENLLRFDPSDHPEVLQRGPEVYLEVKLGTPEPGEDATPRYRLKDGRAETASAIPSYDQSYVPGHGVPQPELSRFGRNLPMVEGGAAFRCRQPGQEEWTQITVPVSGVEMVVQRVAPMGDGRLVLSTGPYGNVHTYDPKSASHTCLGSPAGQNVYDLLRVNEHLYFCGYPNAILGTFEGAEGKLLGNWHDTVRAKHALFLVRGADGRLYAGNHAERECVGGSLGWYDPKTGQFGGIRFPNDDCEWLTMAQGGRLIVYASDFSHDPMHPEIKKRDGRLIVYDTNTHEIVRQFSPLADGSAGIVVETQPGIVLGLGLHEKKPVMYTADLVKGRLLGRAELPAAARRDVALGPDGKVYTFLDKTLVRVDPEKLTVTTICETTPGRMAFVGCDLYLAGDVQLRRIANVSRLAGGGDGKEHQ